MGSIFECDSGLNSVVLIGICCLGDSALSGKERHYYVLPQKSALSARTKYFTFAKFSVVGEIEEQYLKITKISPVACSQGCGSGSAWIRHSCSSWIWILIQERKNIKQKLKKCKKIGKNCNFIQIFKIFIRLFFTNLLYLDPDLHF